MGSIEVRNIAFDLNEDVPRYWHGGRRSVTAFFDNLSIFFPPGERFFIAAVRAHRHLVEEDEPLGEDVRRFCAQEGVHSREHVRYNRMLAGHGLPTPKMEGRVTRLLRWVTKVTPPRWRLSATCALEHFTALMAHLLLSDEGVLDGADPTMAALWRWHAAEENEHKAVAFDVYERAGGNYPERCGIMVVATAVFWAKVLEHQVRLMHADGIALSPREWARLFHFVFVRPGWAVKLAPLYLQYFRPGFHPWDVDNRELLDQWKSQYEAQEASGPSAAVSAR
jgi:predicted metal-dependent hydrolase